MLTQPRPPPIQPKFGDNPAVGSMFRISSNPGQTLLLNLAEDYLSRGDLPSRVDFRETGLLPPVLNQGQLGSCVSNAASNGLRYLMAKEGIASFQPSRLFLYWYARMDVVPSETHTAPPNPREDSGIYVHSVCSAITVYHSCPEPLWPYNDNVDGPFSRPPDAQAQNWAHRKCEASFIPLHSNNLQDLKSALAAGFPVLIGIQVYQQSFMQSQNGIVTMPEQNDVAAGGHCILVVGYDDTQQVFIAMNSWTADWGDQGFCYMPYQYLASPNLSYDWDALRAFAMWEEGPSAASYNNRPANAQAASGAYFGESNEQEPSCFQRLCCCA
ncbi:hypothetical protein WJX73_002399 [Symbiochloris irregularis]|uniref:Peptidase C1A papain C-terminal domain-containing protein n=1 Tax=Symbiochloris irregularis TaxID=706552 RepID=A0AAW1P4A3_9CHLO